MSISIPEYKPLHGIGSPVNNIEYILQRKATEHKKNGNMTLAIACLRKSNEIMPFSNFLWPKKDYLRLVEYLRIAEEFDEANRIEDQIENLFYVSLRTSALKFQIEQARASRIDLLISSEISIECAVCSSFCRRIFSISGKDRHFPPLPSVLLRSDPEHKYCLTDFYLYFKDVSMVDWKYRGSLVDWCNRPYKDERSSKQKKAFRDRVIDSEQELLDRNNFALMREKLPDIAPKSFGGFKRMKNMQSKNYLKLVEVSKQHEIDLAKLPDLSIYHF
jgi:hypothetical protein